VIRRTGGGASINLATKRGTNAFHGSARYFLSHDHLSPPGVRKG
jgi:hypothetical protein